MKRGVLISLICVLYLSNSYAQNRGKFSGSIQSTSHFYLNDNTRSIIRPDNPWASNNYLQLNYINGPFSAGLQYEAYMPPLLGYPYQLEGNKITNRYFRYTKSTIDATVGSFYEQFGNGLILRAYENRDLGINNSIDGIRVVYRPLSFFRLTGIYGKQRKFIDIGSTYLKGIDADLTIDSIFRAGINLKFGLGIVSKYEQYTGASVNIPTTVNASSFRLSINNGDGFELNSELAIKTKDPSKINNDSFEQGSSLLVNGTYGKKGFGVFFTIRFLKNMDFRNERISDDIYSLINYLPSNTKQHSYMLANLYPYSTQANSEAAIQGEINYSFKKNTTIGGRYGVGIKVNFSQVRGLLKKNEHSYGSLISFGDEIYFQDINLEVTKKWSPKLKTILSYINLQYDKKLLEAPIYDFVKSSIVITDLHYRVSPGLSLRTELQHLWTKQDQGNWASALLEIGYAPYWSAYLSNMVNYQYSQKVNYSNIGISYSDNFFRLSLGYGRQREGLVCAGGVCQKVPSYRGINLKLNVNF